MSLTKLIAELRAQIAERQVMCESCGVRWFSLVGLTDSPIYVYMAIHDKQLFPLLDAAESMRNALIKIGEIESAWAEENRTRSYADFELRAIARQCLKEIEK